MCFGIDLDKSNPTYGLWAKRKRAYKVVCKASRGTFRSIMYGGVYRIGRWTHRSKGPTSYGSTSQNGIYVYRTLGMARLFCDRYCEIIAVEVRPEDLIHVSLRGQAATYEKVKPIRSY